MQNKYASDKKRVPAYNADVKEWSNSGAFSEGNPVMFTRNDWEPDLSNGSLRRIIKAYDKPKGNDVDAAPQRVLLKAVLQQIKDKLV